MNKDVEAQPSVGTSEKQSRYTADILRTMANSVMEVIPHLDDDQDTLRKILKTRIVTVKNFMFTSHAENEVEKQIVRSYAKKAIVGGITDKGAERIARIHNQITPDERAVMHEHSVAVFREYFHLEFHSLYDQLCAEIAVSDAGVAKIPIVQPDDATAVTTAEIDVLIASAYQHII